MHLGSSYSGIFRRADGFPAGGAVGDVLTLDAGSDIAWAAPAGGGTSTRIAAPFVSSDGVLLDDARGIVDDWLWDSVTPADFYYRKATVAPHRWVTIAIGTVVPS